MKKVPYGHVVFNAEWAASKTEKQFVDHEKHSGLTVAQLKEVYKLCKLAVKPAGTKK
jgi:hypothetical protein